MNAAREMAERQFYYDRLHHQMRLEWLESLPRLDALQDGLLKQSRQCLECPMEALHSVDVEDAEYVAELDAFAARRAAGLTLKDATDHEPLAASA